MVEDIIKSLIISEQMLPENDVLLVLKTVWVSVSSP